MPNKCTMCGKIHPDNAQYLMKGCDKCGGKFFFYVRQEHLKEVEEDVERMSRKDMEEIEKDVREIIPENFEKDETVVLDLEAIKILKPGKYVIDVTTLFNQRPIVIRIGPGRYEIDLSTIMQRWKGKVISSGKGNVYKPGGIKH